MNVIEYVIVYFNGQNTETITCRVDLLYQSIEKIIKQFDNEVSIFIQPKSEAISKSEKQKCYKSKCVLVNNKEK